MSVGISPAAASWSGWYRRALPAYWVFLFTSTHLPRLSFGEHAPRWADKAAHLAGYGLLAFLFWRFVETFARPTPRLAWIALLLIAVYGALDECLQAFVSRGADVRDWACDVAGAAAVLALLETRRRRAAARSAAP